MNIKKILSITMLTSCMGLMAAEPLQFNPQPVVKPGIGTTPLFERNAAGRGFLKTKSSFSGSGKDWDHSEVSGSGLFIHLGIFFPPSSYMNPYGLENSYGTGYDFEVGNYFRFIKIKDGLMGLGLRATWLSVSYASYTEGEDVWRVAQISPLRLGPQFSFALTETMGFDVFYQIGFNLSEQFGAIDDPNNAEDIGFSITHTGITHEVGAAFHYKVFCLGFGYRMGMVKNIGIVIDGEKLDDEWLDDEKSSTSNFHVTFGLRF
jgi:hypothetical protein